MGLRCCRHKHSNQATTEENTQAAEIERRIEQETKAEKHIQKLLLLGAGEPGKSTIFKQIKLLFQTGFDERELQSYTPVIHANVYQTIKEDVLHARVRTTGVVEIQFSPVGENKKSGEVYRLFDVGGQRNERRKWIHLFEGVRTVIFCAAISEYDRTLFEDENKNRIMETKELLEWVLKQKCFEKTSFMLFLNKFDIFEKKVSKVPLNVCEWFKDYQPASTRKQEVEHAYEFVKKKFEELYYQNVTCDHQDRVFKIYRTTALDQKLVKKTFKLVDETLRRRNLFEAGLL
ncbi:hypothetical protein QVD17_29866 [Tagetes erecta]|uniref:Guanine nucleotide-binding protein alpha subunit n=1 Tax=Tagetes erecta TaxID=13708 RepID=A0AAD8K0F2_TARER|nr:hypothetical protein QVD17_29866 [Tagetes erecta]